MIVNDEPNQGDTVMLFNLDEIDDVLEDENYRVVDLDKAEDTVDSKNIFQNSFPIENANSNNNITFRKPSKNHDYDFDQLFLD